MNMGKEITSTQLLRETIEPLTHEEDILPLVGKVVPGLLTLIMGLSMQSRKVLERMDEAGL